MWVHSHITFLALWFGLTLLIPQLALALRPDEILVVANSQSAAGPDLASYYMKKRNIPRLNLLLVSMPVKDSCTRKEYEDLLARPVRKSIKLTERPYDIRCILLTYEIPLRVKPHPLTEDERMEIRKFEEKLVASKKLLAEENLDDAQREEHKKLCNQWEKNLKSLKRNDQLAAVDSELTLVLKDGVPLSGWIPNPLYVGYRLAKTGVDARDVLMVARLDAPDPGTVRRMIDDALYAEKQGLQGVAYFDCRYPKLPLEDPSAYQVYDWSLRRAAKLVRSQEYMDVVIDRKTRLFPIDSCPRAALYCGWYSLGCYVDAFTWVRGAVAYHIASGECRTLRGSGKGWCKMLLLDGVAATIGPVAEPYVQAFPPPEKFFRFLLDGNLCLAEAYFLSCPVLSWRMILIGDPLYRPFRDL